MRSTVNTVSGNVEISAGEKGIPPGVVRVKLGPFLTISLTVAEALSLGNAALQAAQAANAARENPPLQGLCK